MGTLNDNGEESHDFCYNLLLNPPPSLGAAWETTMIYGLGTPRGDVVIQTG